MYKDDYKSVDGLGLAQLIQTGEVSAREIAKASIDVIQEHSPRVNPVIELFAERALEAEQFEVRK